MIIQFTIAATFLVLESHSKIPLTEIFRRPIVEQDMDKQPQNNNADSSNLENVGSNQTNTVANFQIDSMIQSMYLDTSLTYFEVQ